MLDADDVEDDMDNEDVEENEEECDDECCDGACSQIYDEATGLLVKAGHAEGVKCPRCWQWEVTDHEHGLCSRCQRIVDEAVA